MSVTGSASSTNNLNVLKGKISSLSPYALDQTLKVAGSAADAKAVGDALEKKVSVTDIADNLNTNESDLPLSAKQGVVLKNSIAQIQAQTEEALGSTQEDVRTAQSTADSAMTAAEDAQNYANSAIEAAEAKMPPDGSVPMTGNLDMGENKIVKVAEPENETDAANKQYVDGKRLTFDLVLSSSKWASTTGEAPYTQEVDVAEMLATDTPHWGVVYASNNETALLQKEAYALVDDMEALDGSVIFTCFEERPEVNLSIQLEVNR